VFDEPEWKDISVAAKDFCKKSLSINDRPTAYDAL
jgi:hypothetical protein